MQTILEEDECPYLLGSALEDEVLEPGDHVVVIGDRENLLRLAGLAKSR